MHGQKEEEGKVRKKNERGEKLYSVVTMIISDQTLKSTVRWDPIEIKF